MANRDDAYKILKIAAAGEILRQAATLAKGVGKGYFSSGSHIAKVMSEHGIKNPAALAAAKAAPYAGAAVYGKKKYDESPRLQMAVWKLKNRLKGGGGYY